MGWAPYLPFSALYHRQRIAQKEEGVPLALWISFRLIRIQRLRGLRIERGGE